MAAGDFAQGPFYTNRQWIRKAVSLLKRGKGHALGVDGIERVKRDLAIERAMRDRAGGKVPM